MDIIDLLIKNGAEINIIVLKSACLHQSDNIFAYILEQCDDINMQDAEGNTALMHLANYSYVDRVKILAENGADLYISNNAGQTALDIAKEKKNNAMIKYI